MSLLPEISVLSEALFKVDSTMGAAESHGALCGMLCAQGSVDLSDWVDHVLGDQEQGNVLLRDVVQLMSELHQSTMQQLNGIDGEFKLLLPDDESDLSERTESLAAWCQGFIYGLAAGGMSEDSELPDDTRELLNDFIEISRAGANSENAEIGEDDELAYEEIMEYVRTGAMLINEELQPLQTAQTIH
jgi:yecA family protein